MDSFLKKRSSSSSSSGAAASTAEKKAPRISLALRRVAFWNACSSSRLLYPVLDPAFQSFIGDGYDVVALLEAWLPARALSNGTHDRTRLKELAGNGNDAKRLRGESDALKSVFKAHNVFMTLADGRKSGVVVAVRKEAEQPVAVCYNFEDGETASIRQHDLDVPAVPDGVYDRTCVEDGHYEDGRVVVLVYADGRLLLVTYAPNNGTSVPSREKRRVFDGQARLFLERARARGCEVIWVGDHNCCTYVTFLPAPPLSPPLSPPPLFDRVPVCTCTAGRRRT